MARIGIVISGGMVQSVYISKDIKELGTVGVDISDFDCQSIEEEQQAEDMLTEFDGCLYAIY